MTTDGWNGRSRKPSGDSPLRCRCGVRRRRSSERRFAAGVRRRLWRDTPSFPEAGTGDTVRTDNRSIALLAARLSVGRTRRLYRLLS